MSLTVDRITQLCGVYEQGKFKLDRSYVYLALINGISQAVRMLSCKSVHG